MTRTRSRWPIFFKSHVTFPVAAKRGNVEERTMSNHSIAKAIECDHTAVLEYRSCGDYFPTLLQRNPVCKTRGLRARICK